LAIFDIEYGSDNGPLEELLLSVDRPGDFCTHGRLFAPMPRLEVDDVGLFSFPVPEAQVGALIAAAERAPYGKGPDTLVDTSVRDCRQIDAARIRVSGQAWGDTFKRILDQAATGLGCPSERLDARLYKLLVYEPGGFFTAHRDTEKMDGMVATLAISLPVAGAGGELVVRHREREVSIDLTAGEPSELAFAAFYADCAHEVRPVREGHRLSLVFNLCLRAGDEDSPRRAPDFTSQVDRIAERLVAWRDRDAASDKLVWVLDHDYSEAGLSFDTLKNVDAALARVLAPAAARAGCELYAAVVRATVHGDATYHGNYVDGWGEWGDEDAGDMEIDEVYESRIWLDGWAGRDGGEPPFEEVPVLPGELLPQGALDDAEPDEQRLHEASGNEGVSLERAYRHAALVVWPRSRTLDVIASTGVDGAVAWVAAELDRNGGTADERIAHLFTKLIDLWPTDGDHDRDRSSRARMLDVLSGIDDEARTLRFLRNVVLSRYRRGDNEHLPAALRVVGLDAADRLLADLVTAHVTPRTSAVLALLRLIEEQCRESAESAWRDVLRKSVHAALVTLCEALAARTGDDEDEPKAAFNAIEDTFIEDENDWVEDDEEDDDWVEEDDDPQAAEPGRPGSSAVTLRDLVAFRAGGAVRRPAWSLGDEAVRDVFALTSRCGLTSDAARAATLIVRLPEVVAPDRTLPAALGDLHREEGLPDTAPYAALWGRATASLLGRSATPPDEPRDWKIASDTNCDCAHCAELRAFCENPDAEVGRFPLREELRCHLEMIIRTRHLDIDHVTERKGRPYTLVCTKNRASHQRRLAEYAEDVSHMESLVRSAPGGAQAARCESDLARLREAVAAGKPAGRGRT
jgi:hypothetical protein